MTPSPPAGQLSGLPATCSVPPHLSTGRGDDAVELAARAGLILDPWQASILRLACSESAADRWAAFEVAVIVSRQNGKGAILEARELAGLFLFGERLILHSAHEFKTASEAFRRVLSHVENNDFLRKLCKRPRTSHGDEGIELLNGNRLRFVARSTGSGRGFSGDCVILDEAYNLSSAAMAALLPTLSARPNPQLWYASSAGMASSEVLRAVRNRGRGGTSASLAYFDYGAESDVDLDDRAAWAAANPALGIRISEDFVEREREALPPAEFARERLGVWDEPGAVDRAISDADWAACLSDAALTGSPVFGVDVSPLRDMAAICAAGGPSGHTVVELTSRAGQVDHRAGVDWVLPRLLDLSSRWHATVVLARNSQAATLVEPLEQAGVKVLALTSAEAMQACGNFYDATKARAVTHLGQVEFDGAVVGAKRQNVGDGWVFGRRKSEVDITPLWAATLAHHGHLVAAAYDVLSSVY